MPETDPTRAPDWRWQEAIRRANSMAYAPRQSDALINRAITFLRLQRQARTSEARARLQEKFPTIGTVQRIRFDPSDGRRDAFEVRLLAGYPPKQIAKLSALDPAVVWTYLALFYDVLDRIDADEFIRTQVIGFPCHDAGQRENERAAMLWLSWLGGPLVADTLLLPGRDVGFPESSEDVGDHLLETTQSLVTRTLALAPLLDHEQARQITRLRVQARQQRAADTGDLGERRYLKNVRAFLDTFDFSIGRSTIPKGDKEKYYTGHAEPTAAEWNAISMGQPVPELDARIAAGSARRSRGETGDAAAQQDEPSSDQIGGTQNE